MKRSLSDPDMAEIRCTFLRAAWFQSWFTWGWFTEILLYVSTEKGSQLGRATQPSSKLGVKGRAMTGADFYPAHIRKSPGTKTHGKTEPSLIRIIIFIITNSIFSSVTKCVNILLRSQAVFLFLFLHLYVWTLFLFLTLLPNSFSFPAHKSLYIHTLHQWGSWFSVLRTAIRTTRHSCNPFDKLYLYSSSTNLGVHNTSCSDRVVDNFIKPVDDTRWEETTRKLCLEYKVIWTNWKHGLKQQQQQVIQHKDSAHRQEQCTTCSQAAEQLLRPWDESNYRGLQALQTQTLQEEPEA